MQWRKTQTKRRQFVVKSQYKRSWTLWWWPSESSSSGLCSPHVVRKSHSATPEINKPEAMAAREEWQPFGSVGHPINMLRNRIMAPNRENNKSRMWGFQVPEFNRWMPPSSRVLIFLWSNEMFTEWKGV